MTINEAEQISELVKWLPDEVVAYADNAHKIDEIEYPNGWYVVFDTFKRKVFDFNLAISYYTVLADLSKQKTSENYGDDYHEKTH